MTGKSETERFSAAPPAADIKKCGTAETKRWIIGLTGPMAAGKNTAADILREKGFYILDADIIAHNIAEKLTPHIQTLFEADAKNRGLALLDSDGRINRKNLGALVFRDKTKLALLESLIHPAVNAEAEKLIDESPHASFVINAALLHKIPVIKRCDFILYIDASIFIRFMRVRKRDALPYMRIAERFFVQRKIFTKCKKENADIYRVENGGTKKRLKENLEAVLKFRTGTGYYAEQGY